MSNYEKVPNHQQENFNSPQAEKIAQVQPTYTDAYWIPLFFIHIAVDVYLLILGAQHLNGGKGAGISFSRGLVESMLIVIAISIIFAVLCAGVFLHYLEKHPLGLIKFSWGFSVVLFLVLGIVFLSFNIVLGVIFIILGLVYALFYWCFKSRFEFAAIILKKAGELRQKFPALLKVAFSMIALSAVWLLFWGFTSTIILSSDSALTFIYLLFSLYWVHNVLQNIIKTTVAGTIGTWYFCGEDSHPDNVVRDALKRSLTYSLGTIIFGSFLMAVLQTTIAVLRALEQRLRRTDNPAAACCVCCVRIFLQCIKDIADWFKRYVYVYVALYNLPLVESGKRVWNMFKHSGWSALINDDIIGPVLNIGLIFTSLTTGIVALGFGYLILSNFGVESFDALIIVTILGLLIGFVTALITVSVIDGIVVTLFTCFAEEPVILQNLHPDLYENIINKYGPGNSPISGV